MSSRLVNCTTLTLFLVLWPELVLGLESAVERLAKVTPSHDNHLLRWLGRAMVAVAEALITFGENKSPLGRWIRRVVEMAAACALFTFMWKGERPADMVSLPLGVAAGEFALTWLAAALSWSFFRGCWRRLHRTSGHRP